MSRSVDNLSKVGERVDTAFAGDGAVQVGGTAVASVQLNDTTESDLRRIELYASPLLLLISLLVFRSLVAAVLPLIVGGLSIAFTLAALRLLSEVMTVDIFALNVVTVLGLGLAIDYSLFMVSRYRDELARSGPGLRTMSDTVGPIGRMVSFSAGTVAAAVASLCIFPQPFLYSTGVGCALVAVLSALVVILVLPAILGSARNPDQRPEHLRPHARPRLALLATRRCGRPSSAGPGRIPGHCRDALRGAAPAADPAHPGGRAGTPERQQRPSRGLSRTGELSRRPCRLDPPGSKGSIHISAVDDQDRAPGDAGRSSPASPRWGRGRRNPYERRPDSDRATGVVRSIRTVHWEQRRWSPAPARSWSMSGRASEPTCRWR